MRGLWVVALFVALATTLSGGQQASPSAPSPMADAQPDRVKVYSVGPDVKAPELLSDNQDSASTEKCKKKVDGKVVLSVLVDATGKPRNLLLRFPLGSDFDKLALEIVEADRFKPGTFNGAPVAVAQSVEVSMQGCMEDYQEYAGKMTHLLRLRSQPKQKFGGLPQPWEDAVRAPVYLDSKDYEGAAIPNYRIGNGVTAPKVLNNPIAEFSEEARKAKYQGACLLSLIVDEHGMPQNVRVIHPLGMGLDEKALEAVQKYRFKPAMKDGVPVPVRINVVVNFRLYEPRQLTE